MNVSASDRHRLFTRLEQVLGPAEAATLMAQLPPGGWDEVATKGEVSQLRGEMNGRFDDLRSDMNRRFDENRADMNHRFDELRDHIDLRVDARMATTTRQLFFMLLAAQSTQLAAVIAAVRLA